MLQTKHIVWLFDAAGQHFQESIKTQEQELIRHQALINEPLSEMSPVRRTRQDKIDSAKEYLVQYREILDFCRASKERAMEMSAQEFAQWYHSVKK